MIASKGDICGKIQDFFFVIFAPAYSLGVHIGIAQVK